MDVNDLIAAGDAARESIWRRLLDHSIARLRSPELEFKMTALEALTKALERCPPKLAEEFRAKLRAEVSLA